MVVAHFEQAFCFSKCLNSFFLVIPDGYDGKMKNKIKILISFLYIILLLLLLLLLFWGLKHYPTQKVCRGLNLGSSWGVILKTKFGPTRLAWLNHQPMKNPFFNF